MTIILFQKWHSKCIDKVSLETKKIRKINAFRAFLFWDLTKTDCQTVRLHGIPSVKLLLIGIHLFSLFVVDNLNINVTRALKC